MDENTSDHRRHPRHGIPLQASLQAAGVVVPCRVHNISAGGALIDVNAQLRIGDRVTIKVSDFGTMVGLVARVSSTTVGIAFEEGEAAMDSFIVEWLALESGNESGNESAPSDKRDRQAV